MNGENTPGFRAFGHRPDSESLACELGGGNKRRMEQERNSNSIRRSPLRRYLVMLMIGWTVLIIGLLAWNIAHVRRYTRKVATHEALASFNKDLLYRRWIASHGGVYVPVTDTTPPNPYMDNIPNRDVTTRDGQVLTLINPAYITRQVHALRAV